MKPLTLWAALLLIPAMTGTFVQAQNENSAPSSPKEPLVHRAPTLASWTITFKYKDETPSAEGTPPPKYLPDLPRTFTVTKTNKTYWEQITLRSGKKYEKWVLDNVQLKSAVDGPSIIPIPPPSKESPEPDYSDYHKSDFEGLEWVSPGSYQGIKSYDGKPAYLFATTKSGQKVTAFLSVDTQLPLYLSDEDTTRTYVYNPAPSAPITPPANFLTVLETYKRGLEALKYHASPP
jgi:hypothetical protein